MDGDVAQALKQGGIVDITTTGRNSGNEHRLEIVFHNVDGDLYITGRPGTRDWYANVTAEPKFTLHLKRGVEADLAAIAEPVTDRDERGRLLERILTDGFRVDPDEARERLPIWVERAPLIRFEIVD